MNAAEPTDLRFSFTGFARRGGGTDHHADGFGAAFFEGSRRCRLFVDSEPCCRSPVAELLQRTPIKALNALAHIRKATRGAVCVSNSHPFQREAWGRSWAFAHNGTLADFAPELDGSFEPVGETDSELAFCLLMQRLRARFGRAEPELGALFEELLAIGEEIGRFGPFNFVLSDGRALFARCSTSLWRVERSFPFGRARLSDAEVEIDFSAVTTERDRVAVVATKPLTTDEAWAPFEAGELRMFVGGRTERVAGGRGAASLDALALEQAREQARAEAALEGGALEQAA